MEKLTVGQRIELVEILTDGRYDQGKFIPGTIRPVIKSGTCWVDILSNKTENTSKSQVLSMYKHIEVSPVGAMIVKKLHNKKLVRTS